MLDPGAMGTLLIGQKSARREQEDYSSGVPLPERPRRRNSAIREGFAVALRRAAEILEPTPAPAHERV